MLNNYALVFDRISPIGKRTVRYKYIFRWEQTLEPGWENFELREMFDKYNSTSNKDRQIWGVDVLTETFGEFNFHCVCSFLRTTT